MLILTAFPAIGGPLPKLAPLVAEDLRRCGCEVLVRGWSAHKAGHESLLTKVIGRGGDLARIRRLIGSWRPDVVYVATSHNWPALMRDIPLALTVRRGRTPLVLHLHGSECDKLGDPGQWLFTHLSLWLMRSAAAVLVLSEEELQSWRAVCPAARFEIVVNPFRSSATSAADVRVSAEAATVLFVGRIVVEKGVFDLVEAVGMVGGRRPCRLVVAGIGDQQERLARRVRHMGLESRVALLGYVEGARLDALYRSADVFVLPSYREGFPLVVMEAMSYGLPIITTPIRGCADHLVPEENAVFVQPGDCERLAAEIERLLDDACLRTRMSDANLVKVADFSADKVGPAYYRILRSVVPLRSEFT